MQTKLLEHSPVYAELKKLLARCKVPGSHVTLSDAVWHQIEKEIMEIYPSLHSYIYNVCPSLSEQDWLYCCFSMFGFDTNDEAKLAQL